MEGMCYVMEGLFGDKLGLPEQWRECEGPAQTASRDSGKFFWAREGDQAPQNGLQDHKKLKKRRFLALRGQILFRAMRTKC
jgi:hypothetical protein